MQGLTSGDRAVQSCLANPSLADPNRTSPCVYLPLTRAFNSLQAVATNTSIADVVQLFNEHGILSCPVYSGNRDDGKYVGIVNVLHGAS